MSDLSCPSGSPTASKASHCDFLVTDGSRGVIRLFSCAIPNRLLCWYVLCNCSAAISAGGRRNAFRLCCLFCSLRDGTMQVEAYDRPVPPVDSKGWVCHVHRAEDDPESKKHWVGFLRSLVHGVAGTSLPKVTQAIGRKSRKANVASAFCK